MKKGSWLDSALKINQIWKNVLVQRLVKPSSGTMLGIEEDRDTSKVCLVFFPKMKKDNNKQGQTPDLS